jgi:VCBS repeat-containing protein
MIALRDIGAFENTVPVAADDNYSVAEDNALSVAAPGVLANDLELDGESLIATLVSNPAHGSLTPNSDGSFTYTPDANYNGPDSFTYETNDSRFDSGVATVSISVTAVNDAPTCDGQSVGTTEDTAVDGALGCNDIDNASLTFSLASGPLHGSVTIDASSGAFTYAPDPNYNGTDSFTFRADDGSLDSNTATVAITIDPVQDPPVAVAGPDQAANETETVSFEGGGSYDVDGDALTFQWDFGDGTIGSGAQPTHAYGDNGSYTVSLTVNDGQGHTETDTLVVTVNNLPPSAGLSGPSTGARGQARSFALTASDPSLADQSTGFTFSIDWGDSTSSTLVGATGISASHTFAASGSYTISVTATDKDAGTSAVAQQSILIKAAEMQGGTLVVGGTTASDTILVRAVHQTTNVALTINGTNEGTFQPSEILINAQSGNDTVTIQSVKVRGTTTYVTAPAVIYGESGSDSIDARGSSANNNLLGGDDADTLFGGAGRGLLIGGLGADVLRAGGGDDILIGGTTVHDQNLAALAALRAEWSRTDTNYQARIGHMTGSTSGGLNGAYLLNTITVLDDAAVDQLFGESGADWFFYKPTGGQSDVLGDRKNNETATQI